MVSPGAETPTTPCSLSEHRDSPKSLLPPAERGSAAKPPFGARSPRLNRVPFCVPTAAVTPCTSPRVPQAVPMDLRIGQRVVKPQDTALLALKQQQLQHQLFLASLHQQQVEQLAHQHVRVRHSSLRGTPTPFLARFGADLATLGGGFLSPPSAESKLGLSFSSLGRDSEEIPMPKCQSQCQNFNPNAKITFSGGFLLF